MIERQTLLIEKRKKNDRIKKFRKKRRKTDTEIQDELLMEVKMILGLL